MIFSLSRTTCNEHMTTTYEKNNLLQYVIHVSLFPRKSNYVSEYY